MNSRPKKLTVFHQLGQEPNPISLKGLLEKLGEGFSERSVRRWLSEMIEEGLIEKIGLGRSSKYVVIHHTSENKKTAKKSYFSTKSEKAIKLLKRPIYLRQPISYSDTWFNTYQPNKSFYIPPELRKQLHKAGKRSSHEDPAGTYARHIFNRLLIDLSYNSSRLEGNTYSLLDTKKLILEGASAEGKLDEEKIMILNHKEAIRYLIENAHRLDVSETTIYTIHYLLSEGLVEAHFSGKVRNHGVRIGGSTYIPLEDPKQLKIKMQSITKKASLIKDPYEQSLFLLIHVTYLQAFVDVNKRTARLSANIPLVKNNLVPLSFNDIEKDDYTSAILAIYELQNVSPLLDLFIFSYMRTCAMHGATVKSLGFDEIRVRYRQQRRDILRESILSCLSGKALTNFIHKETSKLIKKEDQKAFYEDIAEDLREIDQSRIAGLGVNPDQLKKWLTTQSKF